MREKEFLPLVKEKLKIEELNPMQEKMLRSFSDASDVMLLSPTGSGKTLAFILPVLKLLKPSTGRVQVVVIAPSRELVIQITGIFSAIAAGFKVTPLYGGHKVEDEINSLSAGTDIIVSTPGRLLDHIRRRNVDVLPTRILVLDEFDKSLELGFENEMKKISARLKNISRTILTSATRSDALPDFLQLNSLKVINFLGENAELKTRMHVHKVEADGKDKLATLNVLLKNIIFKQGESGRSIVFVNYRESAERVSEYLKKEGLSVVLYHGQLDQRDREKAIAMFNNGSRQVLVATDLAARGLDIQNVTAIIHYHQALTAETYTHRNGRTARIDREGDVYIIIAPEEDVKEFTEFEDIYYLNYDVKIPEMSQYESLYFSAGKKEKLSKGDILGFLTKECGLSGGSIGKIDVYDHYSLAAVSRCEVKRLMQDIKGRKIKGEKRLISVL